MFFPLDEFQQLSSQSEHFLAACLQLCTLFLGQVLPLLQLSFVFLFLALEFCLSLLILGGGLADDGSQGVHLIVMALAVINEGRNGATSIEPAVKLVAHAHVSPVLEAVAVTKWLARPAKSSAG